MSVLDRLFEILQKDPDIERRLQAGFKQLLIGKVDPDSSLTVKARKQRMQTVVDQMTQPDFVDGFKDRHAYYASLLGTAASTAAVCSRGAIVEHLHLPGFHFYFPPSEAALDLAQMRTIEGNDPVWSVTMRVGQASEPYEFLAFKLPDSYTGGLKAVRARLEEIIRDEPKDGERKVFLQWLDAIDARTLALQGIARSQTEERYYFLRVARVDQALDYDRNRKEYEGLGWSLGTVVMKLGGAEKAAAAMKEGLEEALQFKL